MIQATSFVNNNACWKYKDENQFLAVWSKDTSLSGFLWLPLSVIAPTEGERNQVWLYILHIIHALLYIIHHAPSVVQLHFIYQTHVIHLALLSINFQGQNKESVKSIDPGEYQGYLHKVF